jgi:hypothetical protein
VAGDAVDHRVNSRSVVHYASFGAIYAQKVQVPVGAVALGATRGDLYWIIFIPVPEGLGFGIGVPGRGPEFLVRNVCDDRFRTRNLWAFRSFWALDFWTVWALDFWTGRGGFGRATRGQERRYSEQESHGESQCPLVGKPSSFHIVLLVLVFCFLTCYSSLCERKSACGLRFSNRRLLLTLALTPTVLGNAIVREMGVSSPRIWVLLPILYSKKCQNASGTLTESGILTVTPIRGIVWATSLARGEVLLAALPEYVRSIDYGR